MRSLIARNCKYYSDFMAKKKRGKMKKTEGSVSNVWYLLPMLFGLVGSIIVWFVVKGRDRKKAKEIAIVGFVLGVMIEIILYLFF